MILRSLILFFLFATFVSLSTARLAACQSLDQPFSMVGIKGTPVVDGKVDESWANAPEITTRRLVAERSSLTIEKSAVSRVRCLWDSERLYFLALVRDAKINTTAGAPWEQDSVEFFLDENKSRSSTFETDDGQYRISASGVVSYGAAGPTNNVEAAVVKSDDGYVVEVAITMKTRNPNSGLSIGFDTQVNNDPGSGKRESLVKWNSDDDEAWRNTSKFGTLHLVRRATEKLLAKHHTDESTVVIENVVPASPAAESPRKSVLTDRQRVPDWAADAVFYQIFPERFRNGDPSNDPTRESLEFVDIMPKSWKVTPWTDQWYKRADWEKQLGDDFYEDGVFHRRYGGDLQGVIDRLDYLSELGINAIYFNPVFYARSLHKYDGNSYHHIDPHFGPDPVGDLKLIARESADPKTWTWTAADKLFLELINKAHKKKIRVIIDGVFNHTGRDFFAFADLTKKQQASEYRDWYVVEKFDDPKTDVSEFKYEGWWGVDTLPVFANNKRGNDLHAAPKKYIMQATSRWMDPNADGDSSDGIDGWRLDVSAEVPNQLWRDWNVHVRKLNKDAYTVAEYWDDAGPYLADCGFSATMNYHGFAYPAKGFLIDGRVKASEFAKMITARMEEHSPRIRHALQNLYDSHDTDRLASMIVNAAHKRDYLKPNRFDYDVDGRVSPRSFPKYDVVPPNAKQRQLQEIAAVFQMTFVGAPMIYYGTEAGMDGADDPCDRMPMVWHDLKYEDRTLGPAGKLAESCPIRFDKELFEVYKKLIALRRDHAALGRGEFVVVGHDDAKQTLVFARKMDSQFLLVCLNLGDRECLLDVDSADLGQEVSGTSSLYQTGGGKASSFIKKSAGKFQLRVPPVSASILKAN